ncbi:hypothetical protein E4U54_003042, partial [Claviceps lovelessii]
MPSPPTSSSADRPSESTEPTTVGSKKKSRKSSAYDGNFQRFCAESKIYHRGFLFSDGTRPAPGNLTEILEALNGARKSVSESNISQKDFEFINDETEERSEPAFERKILPLIFGKADDQDTGHLPFNNLASLTGGKTVNPNPDVFFGAHYNQIDADVRESLQKIIVPFNSANDEHRIPVAPNLFVEIKSSTGDLRNGQAQAMLDGAHGAVIMNSLQNYLLDEPVYDGNAYAFSVIFREGVMRLFAHHLTAPAEPGQKPCIYMTDL